LASAAAASVIELNTDIVQFFILERKKMVRVFPSTDVVVWKEVMIAAKPACKKVTSVLLKPFKDLVLAGK